MGKALVIVESPAKAKTINKYLGSDYIVKSSVGHIRDLPTGASKEPVDAKARAKQAAATRKMSPAKKAAYKKKKSKDQLIKRMGINPDKDWKAEYEILPGKEKVVAELRKLAKNADQIYLATDLDREGEAIAWHLKEAIGGDDSRYRRVVFNEITKKAIQKAFEVPSKLDIDRVNAQQARRFLDRVVGFMVSPLLWAKVARGLSAGRVQSVAVRMVVEREREIRAFIPEEYWEVKADLSTQANHAVQMAVVKQAGKNFRPNSQEQTQSALDILQSAEYKIASREDKPTKSRPSAPFITSSLQAAASTRLGFGVKKTMMLAQRLYEAGYITYMRTDSTNLSGEAIAACREHIASNYGDKYLPDSPRLYSSKDGAQEAHEAIRPSSVDMTSTQLKNMERDAERLYELIWRQFVACQMTDAQFTSTSIIANAADFELKVRGRVMLFDGFLQVQPQASKKEDEVDLPNVSPGDVLTLEKLDPSQHFTKPTARYSEAALVKELEKKGIGRPSTYASIISTIQDRGYVRVENKRFYAEKMGEIVTDRLAENFSNFMDYSFTAEMEESLDLVAEGKQNWTSLLDTFYSDFSRRLELAEAAEGGMRSNAPTEIDIACSNCERPMAIRTASTGVFLGCTGYGLPPKERCKQTLNLTAGDEAISVDADDEAESRLLMNKRRCQKCNTSMTSYLIDESRKLHVCGNNPDCDGYEIEEGQFKIKGYEGPIINCDKCSADMQLKSGRFGKYFGCTAADCKNTRKLLKNGEAAPPKMDPIPMPDLACRKVEDHYVLRDGAAGLFLAASQYPKKRETRSPLVSELLTVKDQLESKYKFLTKGPEVDPKGNPAVIRYSRKNKQHYITSEKDGKTTSWRSYFSGGLWSDE